MLYLFGIIAFVAAGSMLFLRQPMRVALALITTMVMLGGIYGLLGVHFIAAFQVLIYVGAVMVFMVYVIMLLELREAGADRRFSRWRIPGLTMFVLLAAALGVGTWRGAAPAVAAGAAGAFSMTGFSSAFLTRYWLEFELTSVFLVAAIVAALAVIRTSRRANG
ncbi:MAG: NADH-quinone oxidoreductase subunit J [Gemmatimonadaceae bacterium]|nr:NADH-quinone oxidoreductase subunit J [Gemmatimonadaceae bacterium]